MIDWHKSMHRTFEYYTVDPITWTDISRINTITNCSIDNDLSAETLGSASLDATAMIGESYIRVYMIINQNGYTERRPMGTFLVQTPDFKFDGKIKNVSIDAYTPLIELKENQPPLGYYIPKGANVMEEAYRLISEHMRGPVTKPTCKETLYSDFLSNTNDTWLTYNRDLIGNANYELGLDELSRVIFMPIQDIASLQPVWTYDDSTSSILYSSISVNNDLYKIPNVVEVIYSKDNENYYTRVVNDDPNSPISTVNRGREIVRRISNPNMIGIPTQEQLDEYGIRMLRNLSSLEYKISYKHAYCPVRVGDCVRLNIKMAGLTDVKAKVVSQSITCTPECPVSENAIFTVKMWR